MTAARGSENDRLAEGGSEYWRLMADCAIATAASRSYRDLVDRLARILRIELGIDEVAYIACTRGMWSMVAASGGAMWPTVLADIPHCEHVLAQPVHADGQLRGYLCVTSSVERLREAKSFVRDMIGLVGASIATLEEPGTAEKTSATAVTARLPRVFVDN